MTIKEVENLLKENNLSIKEFWDFMRGQTMGLNDDGSTDVYDCDVNKFIEIKKRGYPLQVEEWD